MVEIKMLEENLPESKLPAQAYIVNKLCPEDGVPLQFTGEVGTGVKYPDVPRYKHVCQKCALNFWLSTTYPTVRYAPILGANANGPIAPR